MTKEMSMMSGRFSLRWLAVVLMALSWLGGCGGPTSLTVLRQSPHRVFSFEVPADCGTVWSRIARRAREQYLVIRLATYQPAVSAQLAPDAQSATVTLVNAGGIGLRYALTADLFTLDPGRTGVNLYCANASAVKEAALWEQWAKTPFDEAREPSSPQK
jgi:hypothetical protein